MVVLEVIFLLSKILIDPSVVKVSLIIYFIWKKQTIQHLQYLEGSNVGIIEK